MAAIPNQQLHQLQRRHQMPQQRRPAGLLSGQAEMKANVKKEKKPRPELRLVQLL